MLLRQKIIEEVEELLEEKFWKEIVAKYDLDSGDITPMQKLMEKQFIQEVVLKFIIQNNKKLEEKVMKECIQNCGDCFYSTPEGQCEKALIIETPDGSMKTIYPGEEGYDKYRNIYG